MREITRFLQEIPPFSQLTQAQVQRLSDVIQIEYFPAHHDILVYGGKPTEYLYIIQRGSVDLLRENEHGIQIFDTLGEGDLFGYPSLIRKKPPIVTVRTREEALIYLLPASTFHQLRRDIPAFTRFFASSTIERLNHRLQAREASASPDLFRLHLRDLIPRNPIIVPATISIREAAQTMSKHNISSVIIESTPPGILTDRDLRNRVLSVGVSDSTPVSEVMSTPIVTLPSNSFVFEALLIMLERGFHHLPVVEDNTIIGLVTDTDILRQQSKSPLFLPRQLQRAETIEDLRAYSHLVTSTVGALLDAGARVSDIGRVVAIAHDSLVKRLLKDAEQSLGPPPCPYAWLVMGSEGRYEQTLRTDQDNALIYADDAPPEATTYFATLAHHVVNHLIECGFPPCPGNMMATNTQWCQPLSIWQDYFETWITTPKETALMRVAIFFDYRKVHGQLDVDSVLEPSIKKGRENRVFLGHLAKIATRQHAPLSFFRQLVLERNGESHDLIDLKVRGTDLIVNIARLYALESGCRQTNTLQRLRGCIDSTSLSKAGAAELIAAFELISQLRLRHQYYQIKQGKPPDNQIPVHWLSALERRELKESLWAIARIQRNIELSFQTNVFG